MRIPGLTREKGTSVFCTIWAGYIYIERTVGVKSRWLSQRGFSDGLSCKEKEIDVVYIDDESGFSDAARSDVQLYHIPTSRTDNPTMALYYSNTFITGNTAIDVNHNIFAKPKDRAANHISCSCCMFVAMSVATQALFTDMW